ncbi:hypothetical protein vseg_016593 [Gypsophila vaccaria]
MGVMVKCSKCRAQLQAPQGATSVRCGYCHTVTRTTTTATTTPHSLRAPHHVPPRKRAVICGIVYRDSEDELKGCINDAKTIKNLLIHRFHFPESHILMLTEEERDPNKKPTKQNIRKAMTWLVNGVRAGDSLVFYYSGHGQQLKDRDGDEVDGFDEYIWPVDFEDNGKISDDEINATIVRPIPHGAKLTAIIDSCSSATMLDLPYLCQLNRSGKSEWKDQRPKNNVWKGTSGGEVVAISGCDDHDTSAETPWETKSGAMTHCFVQAIKRGHGNTYGSLLTAMRDAIHAIKEVDEEGHLVPLTQVPQLSANKRFEIFSKPFSF